MIENQLLTKNWYIVHILSMPKQRLVLEEKRLLSKKTVTDFIFTFSLTSVLITLWSKNINNY